MRSGRNIGPLASRLGPFTPAVVVAALLVLPAFFSPEGSGPLGSAVQPTSIGPTVLASAHPEATSHFAQDSGTPSAGGGPPQWVNFTPGLVKSPPARANESLAYDAALNQSVLFGGAGTTGLRADTWVFNGTAWVNETPGKISSSPSPRQGAAMAYDAEAKAIILFGGTGGVGTVGDTWAFNGSRWSNLNLSPSPPARSYAAMAADPGTPGLILFGGHAAGGALLNDTWRFHANAWSRVTPIGGRAPSPRDLSSFSSEPALGGAVLFGGLSPAGAFLGDTWTYKAGVWAPLTSPGSPSARAGAMLSYDPTEGGVGVLFGGSSSSGAGARLGDTWLLSGSGWTNLTQNLSSSPPPRSRGAIALAPLPGTSTTLPMLFGGKFGGGQYQSDSWLFGQIPLVALSPVAQPNQLDVGLSTTLSVSIIGGVPPYQTTWQGLPQGCPSANALSLQCTPTSAQSYRVWVMVKDAAGSTTISPGGSLIVNTPPTITLFTASPYPVTLGSAVTFRVTVTGGTGAIHVTYTGLPTGCRSIPIVNLTCTPNATGQFNVSVQVYDTNGLNATSSTLASVVPAPHTTPLRTWLIIGGGAAAAVVVLLLGLLWWRRRAKPPPGAAKGASATGAGPRVPSSRPVPPATGSPPGPTTPRQR